MKLATFHHFEKEQAGCVVGGAVFSLAQASRALGLRRLPDTVRGLLEAGEPALKAAAEIASRAARLEQRAADSGESRPAWLQPLSSVRLAAPIPDPEKIICVGQNYLDHIKEQEKRAGKKKERAAARPKNPIIFSKFRTCLNGPFDSVPLPPRRISTKIDFEAELAVVIGRTLSRVTQRGAAAGIAGYMVMNDVTARDAQAADKQWTRAKGMDGFAPCGPWLTTADEIANPHRLGIWTRLNGVEMQRSNTKQMLFKIPRIIAYLSQSITLRPGDIIATGTPPGVGAFREPPVFMKPGDVIECGVDGLGALRNTIVRG